MDDVILELLHFCPSTGKRKSTIAENTAKQYKKPKHPVCKEPTSENFPNNY